MNVASPQTGYAPASPQTGCINLRPSVTAPHPPARAVGWVPGVGGQGVGWAGNKIKDHKTARPNWPPAQPTCTVGRRGPVAGVLYPFFRGHARHRATPALSPSGARPGDRGTTRVAWARRPPRRVGEIVV